MIKYRMQGKLKENCIFRKTAKNPKAILDQFRRKSYDFINSDF